MSKKITIGIAMVLLASYAAFGPVMKEEVKVSKFNGQIFTVTEIFGLIGYKPRNWDLGYSSDISRLLPFIEPDKLILPRSHWLSGMELMKENPDPTLYKQNNEDGEAYWISYISP